MNKPHVEHIHIAGAAGAPMRRLSEVTALKGLGLAGDRYWARSGFWQDNRVSRDLTLIEGESIDRIANELGAAYLVYLGFSRLLKRENAGAPQPEIRRASLRRVFAQGVLSA